MAHDQDEVEWQYDAADLGAVEQWLREKATRDGVAVQPAQGHDQTDTYYDTADWRIYRAGYALRVRHDGDKAEATLKSLAAAQKGLRRRREISEDLAGHAAESPLQLPGPVGQRARAMAGAHPLRVLFEARTLRRTFDLHAGQSRAEIALDDTRVQGAPAPLQRVEVESTGAAHADLEPFVRRLRKACKLQDARMSKFETGLSAHNLTPGAPVLGSTDIDDDSTTGELALALLRKHFAAVLAREAAVRVGEEGDAVHHMRVSTRRLRSLMRIYKDALPDGLLAYREELSWAAEALGAVRDLDVLIQRVSVIPPDAEAVPAGNLDTHPVASLLTTERDAARKRLMEALDSARYDQFVSSFCAALREPGELPAEAETPALKAAPHQIRRLYDKAMELGDELVKAAPPSHYHHLRIQCKHLRYGVESVPQYRKAARDFVADLGHLQDVLGAYQDAQAGVAKLKTLSENPAQPLPAETLLALGALMQRFVQQGIDAREEFPGAYAALKGKSWQRLRKAMDRVPGR